MSVDLESALNNYLLSMTGKLSKIIPPEEQIIVENPVKTFWNARADAWQKISFNPESFYSNRTKLIANLVEKFVPRGKSLDIGSGNGLLCYKLMDKGFDVYGTDISDKMVEKTRQLMHPVAGSVNDRFKTSENSRIPFQDKFDLISAIGVFPYIADYESYLDYLLEFLAPDGFIVASCTNRVSFYNLFLILEHLQKINTGQDWRKVLINLLCTGVWSGGYVDYAVSRQCYSAHDFDKLFQKKNFRYVSGIDLFNISFLDSDKKVSAANRFKSRLARRFAWSHVGLYRR